METLKAIIEGPDGAIIARYYETPDEDHDIEIRPVIETDRIHEAYVRKPISHAKVKNDVEEFFESIDDSYSNINWTINMK